MPVYFIRASGWNFGTLISIVAVVAIAIVLALIPTIFFALLIWWLDRHEKEPLPLLLVAFLWGAIPAFILAIVLELVVGFPVDQLMTSDMGRQITSASIVAPVVEEVVKAIILVVLFLAFRREFDDALDGVVYGAIVGLGFAMVENVLYLASAAYDGTTTGGVPAPGNMLTLWALRAGLFGLNHSMFTAFTGAALGLVRSLRGALRGVVPVLGLVAAITFHAMHNFLSSVVGITGNGGQDTTALTSNGLGILISDSTGMILIVSIAIISGIKETQVIRDTLLEEVSLGRLTPHEYDTLVSSRLRWTTRWSVLFSAGVRRWRQLGKFFDLATEFAFRKHRMSDGNARQQDLNALDIARNWDDLLRVAGSLKLGKVGASEFIRSLYGGSNGSRGSRSSMLARAIAELGRITKTLYLLSYLDDETYRRRILTQLNRGEARHSLARVIFHGHRGELRQKYREGQEDQLGALGLVLNMIVLWNTRYMHLALNQLHSEGVEVKAEDVVHLSPLMHENINMLGRCQFTLAEPVQRGELRSLCDPNDIEEQIA